MKHVLTGVLGLLVFVPIAYPQSVPSLVNYQGILTDESASPVPSGLYSLQFRVWDSPTATNSTDLVWGQQQSVSVQSNGVFHVILGAPGGTPISGAGVNDLRFAFADPNRFLGVTIVSQRGNSVNNPTEILPRQQFLSAPFAITAGSAGTSALATNALSATSVAPGSVGTSALAFGAVQLQNLASRTISTNSTPQNPVAIGGIAFSQSSGYQEIGSIQVVAPLSVTITTSGRPVFVGLVSDGLGPSGNGYNGYVGVTAAAHGNTGFATYTILRDSIPLCTYTCSGSFPGDVNPGVSVPASAVSTVDGAPSAGTHTYSFSAEGKKGAAIMSGVRIIAYEL